VLLEKAGVADRVSIDGGSFFKKVPAGGDLYILEPIVHDWPDEQAVDILRNVRTASGAKARIVLVEMVIPEHHRDFIGKWGDLEMLLCGSGRERSTDEYRDLIRQSGLEMTRVLQTASPYSLVEAKVA
jgi:C-methyltransferase